jgi:choline dehydrogenase-like flavoprotein
VLLIEAGGSHHNYFDAQVPYLSAKLARTGADWNYTTVPQVGYSNRTVNFTRGHVLGGSSTINYMAYNRASNDTYDRWAKITEDDAWSWKELEPYYLRNSRLVPPADDRNYLQDVIAPAHGYGPVNVSIAAQPYLIDNRVIEASKNLGGRFAFNRDLNAGDYVGISWSQSTISNGIRDSAATAYLDPLIEACQKKGVAQCGRNLDILLETQVTRLVQSGKEDGVPAFRIAEIANTLYDAPIRVRARKEIILSAGVVGTPQLLMLSGIGSACDLTNLNIPIIVDLPSVGRNLTDHPLTPMYFTVKQNTTIDTITRNPTIMQQALQLWNRTHQGPLANTASNTYAFMQLPENATIFEKVKNPAAGSLSGNTELLFDEGFVPLTGIPTPMTGNYLTVLTVVTSPTSRGSITLNSSDPFVHPIINPNYLTSDFDQYAAVQALKDVFTFLRSESFEGYIDEPYGPLVNRTTDSQLLEYVRAYAQTIYHSVGTAKMSPIGADWGVVNPDLTVKGTKGLRVADASVFVSSSRCGNGKS